MATPMRSSAVERRRPCPGDAVVVLLVAAAVVVLLLVLRPAPSRSLTAHIVLDGETVAEYDLDTLEDPVEFTLDQAVYPLTVRIEPGRICVLESDCPSQDCVRTGWIRRAGQQIICLPDRLVISLTGSNPLEFDAISG